MLRWLPLFMVTFCVLSFCVTPKDYGAKGDTQQLSTCGISSGSANLTCSGAGFTSADVGKAIAVVGASVSGNTLATTISTFTGSTQVSLATSASTTVSNALTYYGTDDTAAVRSCVQNGTAVGGRCTLNDGTTFMVSETCTNLSVTCSTISISGPSTSGGILDGSGTIVFAPQSPLSCMSCPLNDRLFYLASTEVANPAQIAAGAISKGATSFTAQNLGDVSGLVKGDWLILTEKDQGATDVVYVDWVQVSMVSSKTVTVMTPFRMAFPNARTFSTSPAPCSAISPCGLSFRKVSPVVQNVSLRDFSVIIPQVIDGSGHRAVGIATRDTLGARVEGVKCVDASQNCVAGYLDRGSVYRSNHFTSTVANELASQVDFSLQQNAFDQEGTALNGFVPPSTTSLNLDFGSGFGSVIGNTFGAAFNSGLSTFWGIHDSVFVGNTFGWLQEGSGGAALAILGGYRNTITANVLAGGDSTATGISLGDSSTLTVNIRSDLNVVWNNAVPSGAFTGTNAYVCNTGVLKTDSCFDLSNAPTCTFATGGGTSPACVLLPGSSNTGGTISLGTGATGAASSGTITLTFNGNIGASTSACIWTLSNAVNAWNPRATVFDSAPGTASDVAAWNNNSVNLTSSAVYRVNYWCLGR